MNLEVKWSRLADLSGLEWYKIVKERESVFVVEQQCVYQETDEIDPISWHLSMSLNGEFSAYVRVVEPGIKYQQPSIGRVMVIEKFRNLNIGRALMKEAIRFTEKQYPQMGIKIGAQVYLQKFYQSFGFENVNEPYDEDGILHIDMIKTANI
jgi:ElaA protein